ncbi:MAG: hypothetical protein KAI29_27285 [Cyclobacteriaceae bacterium]|nr:hypothetical protein [Cyclobacteriaceae bacterium]
MIFINGKELRFGSNIGRLLKEWKPKKEIKDDCLTLIWGDLNFFKTVLEASSVFYPEETLVKDRSLKEVLLTGTISAKQYGMITNGIIEAVGDPTGHLELPNLSSYNWIHEGLEVSANYLTNTETLKIIIRKL